MGEYIDRAEALSAISNWLRKAKFPLNASAYNRGEIAAYETSIEEISELPAADVVEVVHGKWIHGREVSRDYVGDACVCIRYEKWWCSECNYTVDWGEPLWHYCPYCGAKMDGGDRE